MSAKNNVISLYEIRQNYMPKLQARLVSVENTLSKPDGAWTKDDLLHVLDEIERLNKRQIETLAKLG